MRRRRRKADPASGLDLRPGRGLPLPCNIIFTAYFYLNQLLNLQKGRHQLQGSQFIAVEGVWKHQFQCVCESGSSSKSPSSGSEQPCLRCGLMILWTLRKPSPSASFENGCRWLPFARLSRGSGAALSGKYPMMYLMNPIQIPHQNICRAISLPLPTQLSAVRRSARPSPATRR